MNLGIKRENLKKVTISKISTIIFIGLAQFVRCLSPVGRSCRAPWRNNQ